MTNLMTDQNTSHSISLDQERCQHLIQRASHWKSCGMESIQDILIHFWRVGGMSYKSKSLLKWTCTEPLNMTLFIWAFHNASQMHQMEMQCAFLSAFKIQFCICIWKTSRWFFHVYEFLTVLFCILLSILE